jgi:hypothetical protein
MMCRIVRSATMAMRGRAQDPNVGGLVHMSEYDLDQLGPVDYVVVEFPEGQQRFTGEVADELAKLAEAGIIRVVDVLILVKDENGDVDAMELSDAGGLGEVVQLEAELAGLLAAEDIVNLVETMDPGGVAGVLVYENVWAAPFGSAVRRAGGQLIANGRIPIQAIIAAVGGDDEDDSSEG